MNLGRPLFICGAPRSGTSLTAHAFRACGVWAGATTTLCEHGRLKQEVLKPILSANDMDPLAMRSFTDCDSDADELRDDVIAVLKRSGYRYGPWLFKDPKLVFCWRPWARAFPNAVWVTVWRDVDEIVASFGRWGYFQNLNLDAWGVIAEHHRRVETLQRNVEHCFPLYPVDLIQGRTSEYQRVAEEMGIAWDEAKVASVIDPDKFRTS